MMMHTFEEWSLLITAHTEEGDEFQILKDWKAEREGQERKIEQQRETIIVFFEYLEERDKLIEALEAIRDQTGEPETKDIARAVLEEDQTKEEE